MVTHDFVGFHKWAGAPVEVDFLTDYHRHVFKVKLSVQVLGLDRELEFFTLQRQLVKVCDAFRDQYFALSCEQLAAQIAEAFLHRTEIAPYSVSVYEDGENGALLYFKSE